MYTDRSISSLIFVDYFAGLALTTLVEVLRLVLSGGFEAILLASDFLGFGLWIKGYFGSK